MIKFSVKEILNFDCWLWCRLPGHTARDILYSTSLHQVNHTPVNKILLFYTSVQRGSSVCDIHPLHRLSPQTFWHRIEKSGPMPISRFQNKRNQSSKHGFPCATVDLSTPFPNPFPTSTCWHWPVPHESPLTLTPTNVQPFSEGTSTCRGVNTKSVRLSLTQSNLHNFQFIRPCQAEHHDIQYKRYRKTDFHSWLAFLSLQFNLFSIPSKVFNFKRQYLSSNTETDMNDGSNTQHL